MKQINGDLLEIKEGVILHQVNTKAVTGGLAGALRRQWPQAFQPYLQACQMHNDPRGVITVAGACILGSQVDDGKRIVIAHIFGQISPGPNTDMKLVDAALAEFAKKYGTNGNDRPVYAPFQMGCGLGGGNWDDYKEALFKHIPNIIIVRKY